MTQSNSTVGHVVVRFPINITVIAILILVILTVVYDWLSHDIKETLVFFSAGVAAVGIVVTAFYTARTLQAILARDARDEEMERKREERAEREEKRAIAEADRQKKQLALQYGERWNDPAM
jgi:hypothetical protein